MKKALMAAAAFVALPVMAQATDTSIKIDTFGVNLLFGDTYRMQDLKAELSFATMKDSPVGLDFRAIDVVKSDPFEGILALAPVDQTFHGLFVANYAVGDGGSAIITGGSANYAIGGGSGAIKTARPEGWITTSPPAMMYKSDRSNLSATLGINKDNPGRYYGSTAAVREGGPAKTADGVRELTAIGNASS